MDSESTDGKSIEDLRKELEEIAKLDEALAQADQLSGELTEGIALTPETLALMASGGLPGMGMRIPERCNHSRKKYIPRAKRDRIRKLQRVARRQTRGKNRGR